MLQVSTKCPAELKHLPVTFCLGQRSSTSDFVHGFHEGLSRQTREASAFAVQIQCSTFGAVAPGFRINPWIRHAMVTRKAACVAT